MNFLPNSCECANFLRWIGLYKQVLPSPFKHTQKKKKTLSCQKPCSLWSPYAWAWPLIIYHVRDIIVILLVNVTRKLNQEEEKKNQPSVTALLIIHYTRPKVQSKQVSTTLVKIIQKQHVISNIFIQSVCNLRKWPGK